MEERWSTQKSAELYEINNWGHGFFNISPKGHVEVTPFGVQDPRRVDLKELVDDLKERGLRPPLLIRFPDIIHARVQAISGAFQKAMQDMNYQGLYRGVFPIKVNQQRHLVDDIVRAGRESNLGLEAGSKPELLVALAYNNNPESLLICNGFKDSEYIETALLSLLLGRNTIIVIDRYSELELVEKAAKKFNIKPRIGFRAKLDSRGKGKWAESSGIKSKFGLTATEIVAGVRFLKERNMLDSLELVHFHMGSQITAMRAIKNALTEACRVYVELSRMGAALKYIDVGGGLGVDYDGSQSNWENSMNYSLQEYANEIVYQIQEACNEYKIPHPHIVTEAGRAITAHHSVLVFNVVGANVIHAKNLPNNAQDEKHESVVELHRLHNELTEKNLNESIQDAFQLREDALDLFKLGYMSLEQKAMLEDIYKAFCTKALRIAAPLTRKPDDIEKLVKFVTDSYYCNFSIFQSAPDAWAVGQQFPIMPIHRLTEEPKARATLLDLTCDSDGKIENFITIKEKKEALELHRFNENEPYYVAMFLLGAYQETLGDIHNLFGDTDAVHVSINQAGYTLDHVVQGDTVTEVLAYMEYDRHDLLKRVRQAVEEALSKKLIKLKESKLLIQRFENGLNGYTYLEDPEEHDDLRLEDSSLNSPSVAPHVFNSPDLK